MRFGEEDFFSFEYIGRGKELEKIKEVLKCKGGRFQESSRGGPPSSWSTGGEAIYWV